MKRFTLFIILLILPLVNGLGVAQDYLEDDTLKLIQGETHYFKLTLQNPEDTAVSVRVEVDGEIATLENPQELYLLEPKTYTNEVFLEIISPEDAKIGDIYTVSYSIAPVQIQEGGQIGMNMKIRKSFDVVIVDENGVGYNRESELEQPRSFDSLKITAIVIGIIIALLSTIILLIKTSTNISKRIVDTKKQTTLNFDHKNHAPKEADHTPHPSKEVVHTEPVPKKIEHKETLEEIDYPELEPKEVVEHKEVVEEIDNIQSMLKPVHHTMSTQKKVKHKKHTKKAYHKEKTKLTLKDLSSAGMLHKVHKQKNDLHKEAESYDKYFHFDNGTVLKSIYDLYNYLRVIPDESFDKHVSENNNDFANWVEGVFHMNDLSKSLKECKTKEEMRKVIEDEI